MPCPTGKTEFVNAVKAHKAMRGIETNKLRNAKTKSANWHVGKAKPYRCAVCGHWHIGHHAPKGKE